MKPIRKKTSTTGKTTAGKSTPSAKTGPVSGPTASGKSTPSGRSAEPGQPIASGRSAAPGQTTSRGSVAGQPSASGRSAAQPTASGRSAAQPTASGRSAAGQPTASGKSAAQPTASGKSAAQPTASGRSAAQPTASGRSAAAQPTASSRTITSKSPTATGASGKNASSGKSTTASNTVRSGSISGLRSSSRTTASSRTSTPRGTSENRTEAHGLRDLFEVGLRDIYYAEKVLAKSLPKMVKNATSQELVNELNNHLTVTKEQVSRLEQIFKSTGLKAQTKKCEAMDGILKETDDIIQNTEKGNVRDAGIISSDQKVDHYEIATFGTLHAYAKTLGEHEAANLLSITLDEAKRVDAALTRLAMTGINSQARNADALTTTKRK